MARRRKKEGVSISLVPILSIQKCAMGVMVVIVCAQTLVGIGKTADQYLEVVGDAKEREPVYVECQEKSILIHPQRTEVLLEALKGAGPSPFHDLLGELQAAKDRKYLVLLVRPEGIRAYDLCFRLSFIERKMDVGKDALLSGGNIVLTKDGRPLFQAKKAAPK